MNARTALTSERAEILREYAAKTLEVFPSLSHRWAEHALGLSLQFPAQAPKGFDVEVTADDRGFAVYAGGFHTHFDEGEDAKVQVEQAFALARDLLSTGMRLRELCAGNQAYRWILEIASNEGWQTDEKMGLLIWNYFGRRSERVYQNDQLPPRFPEPSPNEGQ